MSTPDVTRDPIDVHVGAQMKAYRIQNRMTQSGLAEALGVTFQQVQKYERGVNRMAASTLAKAAGALGCTISDLYPGEDSSKGAEAAAEELNNLFERMKPRQREALLVTARALADVRR
jgi:transcriptional regulator with XRE-family HTH domain